MNDNEIAHKMYSVLMQSYQETIQNGGAIMHWINKMKGLGVQIEPKIKNMMMAHLGLAVRSDSDQNHTEKYIVIRTSSFGDICVPRDLANRALVLGFLP